MDDCAVSGNTRAPYIGEKRYIGTKIISAWPQSRKGKGKPDDGSENEPGYGVQYADGYVSWSPKAAIGNIQVTK